MQQIDQLSVEFHGVEEKDYVTAINRLEERLPRRQRSLQQLGVRVERHAAAGNGVRSVCS